VKLEAAGWLAGGGHGRRRLCASYDDEGEFGERDRWFSSRLTASPS
jgi:hypothetical protein